MKKSQLRLLKNIFYEDLYKDIATKQRDGLCFTDNKTAKSSQAFFSIVLFDWSICTKKCSADTKK